MQSAKQFALMFFCVVLVLALPKFSKALTYQEILPNQEAPPGQPRVLGAITPSPDINSDGIVNSLDVAVLVSHLGQNYPAADLNSDGIVNSLDFSMLSSWWFASR